MAEMRERFFVYGSLTDPAQVARILDEWTVEGSAILDGLHRVDGAYPTLAPGGQTAGRLLRTREGDRLDRYEGVRQGLYRRVDIPVAAGGSASVYVGDPVRVGAAVTWPGSGSFSERVTTFLADTTVVIRRPEASSG